MQNNMEETWFYKGVLKSEIHSAHAKLQEGFIILNRNI